MGRNNSDNLAYRKGNISRRAFGYSAAEALAKEHDVVVTPRS